MEGGPARRAGAPAMTNGARAPSVRHPSRNRPSALRKTVKRNKCNGHDPMTVRCCGRNPKCCPARARTAKLFRCAQPVPGFPQFIAKRDRELTVRRRDRVREDQRVVIPIGGPLKAHLHWLAVHRDAQMHRHGRFAMLDANEAAFHDRGNDWVERARRYVEHPLAAEIRPLHAASEPTDDARSFDSTDTGGWPQIFNRGYQTPSTTRWPAFGTTCSWSRAAKSISGTTAVNRAVG